MLKRIAFLLLLLPAFTFAEPLDRVVAIVNDSVITASELNTQVETLRQQILAQKVELPSERVLKKQVLQHLINTDLQLQLAKQHNITVDNAELNDAIAKIAEQNNLSLSQLREALQQQGLTWQRYRENLRKEIIMARLQQKAVGKDVKVTPEQVENYLKSGAYQDKTKFTYHLQNMIIPLPEEPTSAELKKAQEKANQVLAKLQKGAEFNNVATEESNNGFILESNDLGDRYLAQLPELFAKEVIKMKPGQVAGPLRAGNGYQIIKLIAVGGKDEKHEVIKTHVRHILIKPDNRMTAEEAKRQANNIYQQLKSGKNFAEMAKQYSLDIVSATKGGDLGWVNTGELVPQFEKAMNSLPLHKISKPVKSMFGWHIIEVLERKRVDDSATFQRQQVMQFLQQRKFSEAVQNWQQHLRTNAYVKILDKELA
ncbi:peptidyl-prolyl cis-trans isomerase D [Legionella busanensis]|uniref:Chaperone SurA n=1 Tax=Legionella busanensis TaxID=190655 RepID=A0A378JHI6_9GAMM|nr:peptidylprolyl isomerase [Legionella busanensis]STX50241.1 peptidyl-prolyl cis-trans isomerase D [Legionella busanensis]